LGYQKHLLNSRECICNWIASEVVTIRFRRKCVLVTGASGGIGRETALQFSKEGANILVNYHSSPNKADATVEAVRETGTDAISVKADVSSPQEVLEMVDTCIERFGRLDILVNNAGIIRRGTIETVTEEDWDRIIDINLKGTFFFAQAAAREMIRARQGGKIINMSSIASEVAIEFQSHYMASKGGVRMLTKGMALELAPYGINVNALAPGTIETEMTRQDLEDPTIREEAIDAIPLGRIGTPLDVARAALFLATEESDYITGEMIFVEGGYVIR